MTLGSLRDFWAAAENGGTDLYWIDTRVIEEWKPQNRGRLKLREDLPAGAKGALASTSTLPIVVTVEGRRGYISGRGIPPASRDCHFLC